MKLCPRLLTLLFGLLAFGANAINTPAELNFCHEDQNAFPWVFPKGNQTRGLDIELIKLLESELKTPINLHKLPWKRCLKSMQSGTMDGAFAASFKQERLRMGNYPTLLDGQLDKERRIHISGYSLYRRKDSNLQWNGKGFENLSGTIGVQPGFSIVDRLKKLKVPLDEGARGPELILYKLLRGRLQGAALQTMRADFVLRNDPVLSKGLEKWKIPISEKPYYLMLSFPLVDNYPEFSDEIWSTLTKLRESEEFKQQQDKFWQLYQE
ncbi:substrate-binding periplasmic protein [Dongshaea marina]|uniref:substrate-binding periplasmic protein n=1 Tax=Dongshaea marina TaxID=2047966 RepID=UPI000D3EB33C|nr:transporter substrate-binding domain-containing protein [Dongshaea marina]